MLRETLSLFKTFEESPTNRGPILSHFGILPLGFPPQSSELVRLAVAYWTWPTPPLSSIIFDSRDCILMRAISFPISHTSARLFGQQMLPIKSSATLSHPLVVLSLKGAAPLASADRVTLHTRDQSRAARYPRWGVVQLVGHLTVNEDGEGSNPSAPANFFPSVHFEPISTFNRSAHTLPTAIDLDQAHKKGEPILRLPSASRSGDIAPTPSLLRLRRIALEDFLHALLGLLLVSRLRRRDILDRSLPAKHQRVRLRVRQIDSQNKDRPWMF